MIQDFPGEGTVVQPARATWDTGYFQEALYSKALEELGYEVLNHNEMSWRVRLASSIASMSKNGIPPQ